MSLDERRFGLDGKLAFGSAAATCGHVPLKRKDKGELLQRIFAPTMDAASPLLNAAEQNASFEERPENIKNPVTVKVTGFWRRWRDSNSRDPFGAYTISSRAPSTKLGDISKFAQALLLLFCFAAQPGSRSPESGPISANATVLL